MSNRPTNARIAVWAVLAIVAVVLPQQLSATRVDRLSEVMVYAVAALGLALLTGFNGQISLGHGAFVGLGAYTTTILVADYGFSFPLAVATAIVFAFVVGLVVGVPALRIKGVYLALVTLAVATLFPQIVKRLGDLTGGVSGRSFQPREGYVDPEVLALPIRERFQQFPRFVAPEWTGLADDQWRYYVFLGLSVIAFVLVRNVVRSRVGRGLIAIRDNEVAAEVVGVEVSRYKVVAFGLSAALAGLAGGMWAILNSGANVASFTIILSITLLVAAVIGGVASIVGPAIGAFIVVYQREFIPQDLQGSTQLILGVILIVLMLVAPGGIVGLYRRAEARWRRRRRTPTPDVPAAEAAPVPAQQEA